MSIASELNALNGYILGAYNEINTMGGTVPANQNMANLASAIGSIPSGSSITVEQLNVSANGTYTAPAGKAYSPVVVNVSASGSKTLYGSITLDSDRVLSSSSNYYTINHNFGVQPDFFFFYVPSSGEVVNELIGGFYWHEPNASTRPNSRVYCVKSYSSGSYTTSISYSGNTNASFFGLNSTTSCFIRGVNSSSKIVANKTVYWGVGTF